MPTSQDKKVTLLKYGNERLAIELLTRLLSGRLFNFSYKQANESPKNPILIEGQKLCKENDDPIRLETRKMGGRKTECLVIDVEDNPIGLLVSVSNWDKPLKIDITNESAGIVKITNGDGDLYEFKVLGRDKV
jgi:hypothetical protein